MAKHTEYKSIALYRKEDNFVPSFMQEKLDGANVRVIVSERGIEFGTRKVLLIDRDFKGFKSAFQSHLEKLTSEHLKPIVDKLGLKYDEFVIYGELVGPKIFDRLNYNISGLKVFFYDLSVFLDSERVRIPWGFPEIQRVLQKCGFSTIPYRAFSEETLRDIDTETSFLNEHEHIEGFILRGDDGIYKCKSSHYKSVEFGEKKVTKQIFVRTMTK